jgi:hypothetical protein
MPYFYAYYMATLLTVSYRDYQLLVMMFFQFCISLLIPTIMQIASFSIRVTMLQKAVIPSQIIAFHC